MKPMFQWIRVLKSSDERLTTVARQRKTFPGYAVNTKAYQILVVKGQVSSGITNYMQMFFKFPS